MGSADVKGLKGGGESILLKNVEYKPTGCQKKVLKRMESFLTEEGTEDIMIVNGYAGTGKTSLVRSIVTSLPEIKMNVVLLAPTGRAAKVLSLYTGMKAYTIHKYIYRQKEFSDEGIGKFSLAVNKCSRTIFIVDEVSLIGTGEGVAFGESDMVSSGEFSVVASKEKGGMAMFGSGNLLQDLLSYVRQGTKCKLILIGDTAQLPPVGLRESPALSRDYMKDFGDVVYCEMTTVVRQKNCSGILYNATLLRNALLSKNYDIALYLERDIERISGGDLLEVLSDAYAKYGDDETIVLCRSNKRANKYNQGIRSRVKYMEEMLVKGEKIMIVKNCYSFKGNKSTAEELEGTMGAAEGTTGTAGGGSLEKMDYIANGDIAVLVESPKNYEERYGLHFADAVLIFPDYSQEEIKTKICLDTLTSESPSLSFEEQKMLFAGVWEDYSDIVNLKRRYEKVKSDPYFTALQIKYAGAITCHKSQGGQWSCVFIDNPFFYSTQISEDDIKWLYTALTRSKEKVYLVNFKNNLWFK